MKITKVLSNVTLGIDNILTARRDLEVAQAQTNVPMLRFNLATDIALAPVRALRLERTGAAQPPLPAQGLNTDVKFVRVYKNINQNDALDSSDLNISEVNTTLGSRSRARRRRRSTWSWPRRRASRSTKTALRSEARFSSTTPSS